MPDFDRVIIGAGSACAPPAMGRPHPQTRVPARRCRLPGQIGRGAPVNRAMLRRLLAAVVLTVLLAAGAMSRAQAQQPASLPPPGTGVGGWTINVAPYLWLPTINVNLAYNLPGNLGGRLPTETSTGPGAWLPKLDIGALMSADAQYGRFSILTDFLYMRLSATGSHISSLDFFGLPSMPISRSLETSVGTTLASTIWTLAGGYTAVQGPWGNFDLLAGFRYLGINARTDYNLALTVTGPRGNGATFGGMGGVSGNANIWNGIVGFRGRIRIEDTGFFLPYYFDIGAGGSNLTWQISGGVGYQKSWWGVALLYRYLSFDQGNEGLVRSMHMPGPMIMANFSF